MKENEQFDDLIRQKANGHEAPVPADAWDNINNKQRKRRFFFFWWLLAGLLLAGNIGYWVYHSTPPKNTPQNLVQEAAVPMHDKNNEPATASMNHDKKYNGPTKEKHIEKAVATTSDNGGDAINGLTKKVMDFEGTGKKSVAHAQRNNSKTTDKPISTSTAGQTMAAVAGSDLTKPVKQISGIEISYRKQSVFKYGKKQVFRSKNLISAIPFSADKNKEANEDMVGIKQAGNSEKEVTEGEENENWFFNDQQPAATILGQHGQNEPELSDKFVAASGDTIAIENPVVHGTKDAAESVVTGHVATNDSHTIHINRPKNQKWWIDGSITPFATIPGTRKNWPLQRTTQMPGYMAGYIADKVKISQQPGVAFTIGIRKNVGKKWAVGTGFSYQQIKEKISMSGTEVHVATTILQRLDQNSSGAVLVNDTITTTTSGIRTINALNSYSIISIPVFAQYRLAQRKSLAVDWHAGSFINLSARYSNSIAGSFVSQNNIAIKPEGGLKVGFDLFTELRVSKALTKHIFVFASPGFRYNLSEYQLKGMFKNTFLHQAGISLGLSIKL